MKHTIHLRETVAHYLQIEVEGAESIAHALELAHERYRTDPNCAREAYIESDGIDCIAIDQIDDEGARTSAESVDGIAFGGREPLLAQHFEVDHGEIIENTPCPVCGEAHDEHCFDDFPEPGDIRETGR